MKLMDDEYKWAKTIKLDDSSAHIVEHQAVGGQLSKYR